MRERLHDTDPMMEQRWRRLLAAVDGGDRVGLACDMFSTVRALVEARVRAEYGELDEPERRVRVFEQMFGADLDPRILPLVLARIRASEPR